MSELPKHLRQYGEMRITIAVLQRRIAELEAQRNDWREAAAIIERDRAAERSRREACEAALREVANAPNRIAENARIIAAYFGEGN